jgi:hypothetical protein
LHKFWILILGIVISAHILEYHRRRHIPQQQISANSPRSPRSLRFFPGAKSQLNQIRFSAAANRS